MVIMFTIFLVLRVNKNFVGEPFGLPDIYVTDKIYNISSGNKVEILQWSHRSKFIGKKITNLKAILLQLELLNIEISNLK